MKKILLSLFFLFPMALEALLTSTTLPTMISSNIAGPAAIKGNSLPQVAVNPLGRAASVWENANLDANGVRSVQAAIFNGSAWSNTFALGFGINPQVAIDNTGRAIAIWESRPPTATLSDIFVSHFSVTTGTWTTALSIAHGNNLIVPQVAMDPLGNAIAVWVGNIESTTQSQIFASEFNVTTQVWSTPVIISVLTGLPQVETATLLSGTLPQIEVNAAGVATVVWQTVLGGARTEIFTRQLTRS